MQKTVFTAPYRELIRLLIEARHAVGINQRDFAQKLGRPHAFVAKYELRERRLDVIEFLSITEALGLDPHKIIRKIRKKSPYKT